MFEETGKWPSEQAKGTERDPDNVAPLVVYLASDAAAGVNGQAFHSFGFGYTLMAQPQAVRRLDSNKRFTPAELAKLFPRRSGPISSRLRAPPSGARSTSVRPRNGRISVAGRASGNGRGRSADPRGTVKTVLIICHANTARSVMAHVLLERTLAERDAGGHIRVRSGGIATYARDGMLPSLDARIVLREEGIHLGEDGLTSTDLKRHRYLLAEADLILTMTTAQKEMLVAFDEARGRPVYTLREFAGAPAISTIPPCRGRRLPHLPRRDQALPRSDGRPSPRALPRLASRIGGRAIARADSAGT